MASDLEVLQLLQNPPQETEQQSKEKSQYHSHSLEIPRFDVNTLSYNDFYWKFMENNWPVILCEVSTHWNCRNKWIKAKDENTNNNNTNTSLTETSSINYDYLRERIGNCQVPVANCNKEYFNSHAKSEMSFYEFLNYWKQKRNENEESADKAETKTNNSNTSSNWNATTDLLYLKDWHLKSHLPDYDFYKVPKLFASDWLNEHLVSTHKDDYRFVYMGPKDTWTPFHSDVFGSFSWSTNILGIKKWLLLPPNEEQKLCDRLGNLPFRIDEQLLDDNMVHYYTIMQKENESLFVPSGWYHQVWNITDTISINHNWFNACNLQRIWRNLSQQMQKVINEINDCRQMDNFMDHCHTMLRASFGINYLDFLQLLQSIAEKRCETIHNNNKSITAKTKESDPPVNLSSDDDLIFFDHYIPNKYHMYHDLQRIHQVLHEMLQDSILCDDRIVLYRKCIVLKERIQSVLK